jgi:hypothetical protein
VPDEIVLKGFASDEEVERVVNAVAIVEKYSADVLDLKSFRRAANAIVSNYVVGILSGKYGDPKNAKEAADISLKILDLVTKNDLSKLGDDLADISDPEVRRETFDEIRRLAKSRVEAKQSGVEK